MGHMENNPNKGAFRGVKLLITGGSSYVGQHLVPAALSAGFEVTYTYFSTTPPLPEPARGVQLDMTDGRAIDALFDQIRPDAVVHLAGSNRSDKMVDVIEKGAAYLCAAADRWGVRLVHYSTDVIFGGESAPYREYDPPKPRHAYGNAKYQAEKKVSALKNGVIIRPTLIFGLKILDRSTEWMLEALKKGEPVNLFTNQYRNPISIDTLIELTFKAIDSTYSGVLHAGGSQRLSRAEFGEKLLRYWGVTDFELLRSVEMGSDAPWPANTILDTQLTEKLLKIEFPSVDGVLEAFSRRG